MLDSFKYKIGKEIVVFDAFEHLVSLCKPLNLELLGYAKVSYQIGWSELLSQLVLELKAYPIKLLEVDDNCGQLDIKFEMLKQRNEVTVWRTLSHFKYQSRLICMGCGNESNNLKTNGLNLRLCTKCYESASKNGQTGTWLDKY